MAKKRNLKMWVVMAVFWAGTAPAIAAGGTIYVDADASPGGDGQSWGTAYKYLQDALTAAVSSDQIWVAAGTYKPDQGGGQTSGARTATLQLINGVAIYGGFAGGETSLDERDWQTNETILSGDLNSDDEPNFVNNSENSYNVVTGSGTDATAVLDGFTITAANANGPYPQNYGGGMLNDSGSPTLTNCTFSGNAADYAGGGMYNENSSPTLTNCTFSGNSAGNYGGGMYNYEYSSPTVTNCTFSGNSADYGHGGGMRNFMNSDATVTSCTFNGNSAGLRGGGMYNSADSDPTVTNCTFNGNSASHGGGMFNEIYGSPTVTNCTFTGNSASGSASGYGGGMYNLRSDVTVTNCTFRGNEAYDRGGGMYTEYSSPTVINCTFSGNSAGNGNTLACDSYTQSYPSTVQMANCILWDGGDEIWNNDGSTIMITYSDVQGGWEGADNIDEDPLFIGPNGLDGIPGTADDEDDNVHLRGWSPCINAGDPSGNYSGQVDVDDQPRVAYGRVDMGADEVFPAAGDFEPDGDVDFVDFAIFANHWLLGVEN